MNDIKTCKYCGAKYIIKYGHKYPIKDEYIIRCPKCNEVITKEKSCSEIHVELVE